MKIPFGVEEFMNVFRIYNTAFYFMLPVMYILGIVSVGLLFSRRSDSNRIISGVLAFFWVWMGTVYHLGYFSDINRASFLFGILFIVQGLVFFLYGTVGKSLHFRPEWNVKAVAGSIFILYALIMYPILGHVLGHVYPASPVFGMAPCPTTIFTFGILLFSAGRVPIYFYIIPFLWAIVGLSAAVNLEVYEDFGLTIAGVIGIVLLLQGNGKLRNKVTE